MRQKFFILLLSFSLVMLLMPGFASADIPPGPLLPDVGKVTATLNNGQVQLHWDALNDPAIKGYHVYYGTKSVTVSAGGHYEFGPINAGLQTSYVLANLSNAQKYYFGVTAYDAQGNESSNYSPEVNVLMDSSSAVRPNQPISPPKSFQIFLGFVNVIYGDFRSVVFNFLSFFAIM